MIGIYFLKQGAKIVYVGQSINIESRIKQHRADKDFNSFEAIECSKDNLNSLEAHYILLHNPILNKEKYEKKVSTKPKLKFKKKKKIIEVEDYIPIENRGMLIGQENGGMRAVRLIDVGYYGKMNKEELRLANIKELERHNRKFNNA